jgi:simple sugar transport system ATP-binding protein
MALGSMSPILELVGIHKRFGPVHALRGADFALHPGELHALLGENGAGKTTLMYVAYGLTRPDGGIVRVDQVARAIGSPRTARRLGIAMVQQHFSSVPALTVAENVALAAGWPVAPDSLRQRVRRLGERVGLPLDPDQRAGRLSVALKQRLEIVKALAGEARILLLDEPTAVLAPDEAAELLGVVQRFTAAGGAAVLITHKLDEALAAADRVTVLRRGEVVLTGPVSEHTSESLAGAMIGESRRDGVGGLAKDWVLVRSEAAHPVKPGAPTLIRVEGLDVSRETGYGIAVRGASLAVAAGEIVGVAAVEGNGQRELLRTVAGRLHRLRGRLEVEGPVGFIPEDRTTEGLIPSLTLTENVVLGSGPGDPWIHGAGIDWPMARERTAALLREYDVAAPGPGVAAATLSGGNQQKLVVARELSRGPKVVVAENPTRGLDIRATAAIHGRLRAAADGGAAVLVYSSDLDEVLELAHRVVVMSRGAVIPIPAGASRAEIGAAMLGGSS